ncbi:beta strand repeat-containing protein [Pseudomarimonas salicorniae]|uniref:GPI anchored serine-threonine rich family protein n=1 Tax=Pseudomarimonas salicorniae TaxID=2933270 RepID=A0ABT0GJN1_9GAMM|nr:GPI anchored serine-threonine rich family protein [Lysobacter sp. CAU 1642]MCK7594757.1 GPI anchored serine-threonine rich family protein [Lysobacter sp. CAU 1642]
MNRFTLFCALVAASPFCLAASAQPEPELAELIASLTSREVAGWQISKSADGSTRIDTADGFQHVALAAQEGGDLRLGCVASLDEAKSFFGRDLRTGKALGRDHDSDEAFLHETEIAARHGMSPAEYRFYSELISGWKSGGAKAGATITIVNNDGANEGFNSTAAQLLPAPGNDGNANLGAQRLALFEAAADIWAAFLDSEVTIQVGAQFNPLTPCSTSGGVLGSAGAASLYQTSNPSLGVEFTSTVYPVALFSKQRRTDVDPGVDINTTFNSDVDAGCLGSGTRFYYGLDNATPGGTVNLFVVLLHELGHGLGFASYANSSGARPGNLPDIWARYQYDATSGKTWDQMTDGERAASAINFGNLFWNGSNVKLAGDYLSAGRDAPSGRVQLYAPNPYEGGSSVSHFAKVVSPNVLMEPSINAGLSLDLDLTRQLMRDIGWFRDSNLDGVADSIGDVSVGGATLEPGQITTISWTQTAGFDRNVTIELSTDGGSTFPTLIAENVANTGSRSWTVPNTPTTQGRVRVREHDFVAPAGVSASNFTIASNTAPSFTPAAAISRQRGSVAGAAVTVGTVSDGETAAGSLGVSAISGGSSSGISASSVSNSAGTVSAVVTAACSASAGTLRFEASDGALTGTGDLQVNLSNNTAPTLGYPDSSVTGGAGATVNPNLGPSDNGSINALTVLSLGTFTGSASVNASGVVTLGSAAPVGTHTLTIRATDNCSISTDASINLTVENSAPLFAPSAAISRQQGSPAGPAVTVGTVSDAQTAAGSLAVSAIAGGSGSGLLIGSPANAAGTVSATVAASCTASTGTQRFQVSDGDLTGTGDLQVNVSANTPPVLAYAGTSLAFGTSGSVLPSTAPSDNGSVASLVVASTGSFTGSASVDASGEVSLGNAGPVGVHTLTVRATDNCGAIHDATLQVEVPNSAPQFTPASAISRQQGSPAGAAVAVGTVSDAQTAAGSLVVSAVPGGSGSGLAIGSPANSGGSISATVAAGCSATPGTQRFEVSDGDLSGTGDLQVNVSANTPPTLGYGNRSVALAGSTTIAPASGPADNGSVADLQILSTGTYLGGLSIDGAGVLSVSNAAPAGSHTITVRATDNCGAVRDASFQLGVSLTNSPPSVTPAAGIAVQQGSPAGPVLQLASVSDAETAAGDLTVSLGSGGSVSGLSTSGLRNDEGAVSAVLSATCSASTGTLQLIADDGTDSASGLVDIDILPNTAPQVGQYADPLVVLTGSTLSLLPDSLASDNGSVDLVSALATGSPGPLSPAGNGGELRIEATGSPGAYPVEVRFRDNCGAETVRSFTLLLTGASIFANGFEAP